MNNDLTEERLVGTWQLVSYEVTNSLTDSVLRPLGDDARGWLLYSSDGIMSVQIESADRAAFADENPLLAGTEELAQAGRTYLAYSGRFDVEGDRVNHHIEVSLFPNWGGRTQQRIVELRGDELDLVAAPPIISGGAELTARLSWRRSRPAA